MIELRPAFITGRDIDDTWYQLLQSIFNLGRIYKKTSGSRTEMYMYALDYVAGVINDPHRRPLSPRMPDGSPLPPPTSDEKIENYFFEYLMNSKLSDNEHYRYSTWIVGSNKEKPGWINNTCHVNQIERIIDHFKIHGYGNEHCYLVVGNPSSIKNYDKPYLRCKNCGTLRGKVLDMRCLCDGSGNFEIDEALRPTTPCLRGLDFRIIDNYLVTHVIYRSWDIFAWPENMGGFTLLNEYVAEHLDGVEPGPLMFSSKSLHCPADMYEILRLRLGK